MDIGTISSRYARALFSLAKEQGAETRVYEDMNMLADSFTLAPGLKGALANPVLPTVEKERLLASAGGIEVCDLYERFIRLVLAHKREGTLLFIAYSYIDLYRKDKKITRVEFTTPTPVSDETRRHLQDKLSDGADRAIELTGHVDPALIGGFRLRVGNYRIDASYATQLSDIRARLLENR